MQKRVDDAISNRFGATLAAAERGDLDAWADASPSHAVALDVTLDQFARHVYRHAPDRDARVAKCDAKCVGVVQTCVERGWDARVPTPQQVFLLMPFRHTQKDLPRLRLALERLDARRETEAQCADLLAKFRRTTLRCLQDLEGQQHVDGDDILEFHEFEPQPEVLRSMPSPVYRTVESFSAGNLSSTTYTRNAVPKKGPDPSRYRSPARRLDGPRDDIESRGAVVWRFRRGRHAHRLRQQAGVGKGGGFREGVVRAQGHRLRRAQDRRGQEGRDAEGAVRG